MTNNFANQSYTINAGSTLSGVSPVDRKIRIVCGRVWLTIAGDEADFWLTDEETVVIPANRMVVVEADQQTSLIELQTVSASVISKQNDFALATYFQKLSHKLTHAFA
ncbi:DUF2917 domain-containing protein [Undibacterium sp. RuRC25W]|uniref:DUF2917 domain-containing protein n=1 Tax=Undibacterium sp. RuRC25W TaxID=3413047 RepID=UPI003BF449A4